MAGGVSAPRGGKRVVAVRRSPLPFEQGFGRCVLGQFTLIARFRRVINGEEGFSTAAFLGVFTVPFVGQETFEHGQQKGAKSTTLPGHVRKEVLLQQASEELLGQVL